MKTGMRDGCRVVAALVLWLSGAAWAQSCNFRFAVTLADGSKVCLTDFGLAERALSGRPGQLRGAIPSSGNYTIVGAPALPHCAAPLGFASTANAGAQYALGGDPASRRSRALAACERQQPAGGPAECGCRVIVEDGISAMARAEFERFAGAVPVSRAAEPERALDAVAMPPAGPASRAVAAAPPAPAATSALPSSAGGSTELADLRRQIEQLQAQMTQAQQPAAPPAAAVAAAPAIALAPAPLRQTARALVIGNAAYQHLGALANPRRDASDMAAKLRSFGIEVDLVLDADRNALVKALADHQRKAAALDVNILYYAGHGLQVGGVNYIAPVDMLADGISAGYVKLNGVALNDALEYLPARTRLVFLDACRDNPASRSLVSTRSVAAPGLAPMAATSGTLISYATRDGAVAEDGRGRNSPYTTALLRHLDAPDDIAVVLRRVRQSVMQMTGNRQEPWEYGSLVGDQLILPRLAR